MDKVYYQDTYLRTLVCKVVQVERADGQTLVRTDRTIFYPESGGQPGDRGKLGPHEVLDTRKADDGDSVLVLSPSCPVKEGDELELSLDWEHRHFFMVMHTAQHLLSGLMFNLFAIGTVAVHQGEEYLTIEVDRGAVDPDVIEKLVLEANRRIRENHRVIYHEMCHADAEALGLRRAIKVEGDVRVVEIEGVDRVACGGVHAASTGEIGLVFCTGHEQIRGHARLYFKCAESALRALLESEKTVCALTAGLTCGADELAAKVSSMASELSETRSRLAAASRRLSAQEIAASSADGICVMEAVPAADLQSYAQAVQDFEDLALLATAQENGRTKWIIALKGRFENIDFNREIRPLLSMINARGGGKTPLFQGVAECSDSQVLGHFSEAFRALVSR